MSLSVLKEKILKHTACLGVLGLGYVGLPLAVAAARAGFTVVGVDDDGVKCEKINAGISTINDVHDDEIRELTEKKMLRATDNRGALVRCDVIAICVPTPLSANRDPDLSFVRHAAESIAEALRIGEVLPKLIILESTSYPGTTDEVLMPILAGSGRNPNADFFLAFSPERIDPGSPEWHITNTPKLVGGTCDHCRDLATSFYSHFVSEVVPLSSARAAEMAKLLENIYRAVNIALVNELWMLCDRMDLDVWEIIQAAATKPFGYTAFWPGPGLGGHCIPIDPFYLDWKAREYGFPTEFIELAGKINVNMPHFVVGKIAGALNQKGKSIKDSRILVLGVAYKADVGDTRESPAYKIMEILRAQGARVAYHDPFVPLFTVDGEEYKNQRLTEKAVAASDCVVILTAHSGVDYAMIKASGIPVVDTRNALPKN